MSFLDSIVDFGKNVISGSNIGGTLARTALLGLVVNQINKSVNKNNDIPSVPDPGVRIQLDPDTKNPVPVIYGKTFIPGIITDAALTNNNQTMWYCITLCEKTGAKISDDLDSEISLINVLWNGLKLNFQPDGITASFLSDEDGNTDPDINGLVKIYYYKNGSASPAPIRGFLQNNNSLAYSLFPNWTPTHNMSNLIFVLVRIDYNKEKNITGLPQMTFEVSNSMVKAGDCIYDYMTNQRYGAGLSPTEIYSE